MEAVDFRAGLAPDRAGYRQLGRYLLCEEIASGGMATVHLGRLLGAGGFARTVAVKRLFPQFARDPEFVAMFLDEARLAARIFHPNVISVQDVLVDGADLFLVMDYVRGAPLSFLHRRARELGTAVPAPIAARILCGALCGLHAAHEAVDADGAQLEIVHRDVSPQNILVGSDGIARVFDFGIAKAAGRLQTTRAGQLKGKLSYMAPEQVSDEAVSRLTDIYAASVVYWEALTGQRLFHTNDERTTLSKVLTATVPPPSTLVRGLPPAIDRVVLRGLDRNPERRYPTAYDMVEAITKYSRVASSSEVGDWVASLAGEELTRCSRLAAALEKLPAAEGPAELAERISLAARDSSVRSLASQEERWVGEDLKHSAVLRTRETAPVALSLETTRAGGGFELDADDSIDIEVPPPSVPAPVSVSSAPAPAAARRRHVIAACVLAVLVGVAPAAIGRCFAASRHAVGAAPGASSTVAPAPKVACDKSLSAAARAPGSCL